MIDCEGALQGTRGLAREQRLVPLVNEQAPAQLLFEQELWRRLLVLWPSMPATLQCQVIILAMYLGKPSRKICIMSKRCGDAYTCWVSEVKGRLWSCNQKSSQCYLRLKSASLNCKFTLKFWIFIYRVFIKYCVFFKILKYSGVLPFSVFPRCQCIYTLGR